MSLKLDAMFLLGNYKYLRSAVLNNEYLYKKMTVSQIEKLIDYGISNNDKELVISLINTTEASYNSSIKAIKYLINNHYNYLVEKYKDNYKVRKTINCYLESFFSSFSDDLIKVEDKYFLAKPIYYLYATINDDEKLERLKEYLTKDTKNFDFYHNVMLLYKNSNKDIPEDIINNMLSFGYDKYKNSIFTFGKSLIKCTCNEKNKHHLDQIFNHISKIKYQNNFYFDDYFEYISNLPISSLKHELLKKLLILNISDNNKLYSLCLELNKFNDYKTIALIISKLENVQKESIFKDWLNKNNYKAIDAIINNIPEEIQEKYINDAMDKNDINKMLVLAVTTDTMSTYHLIYKLVNVSDFINIFLISNAKGRFNSYVMDRILKNNNIDYIIYLLNQLYILKSIGFINLIKFIIDYKYIDLFNVEDQEVIKEYFREKEDFILTLKK